jgi:hypothetical protein
MIKEERFQNNMILRTVGKNTRAATTIASEPKNLITQYARTELRKASFAIRVTEPWNTLPTELKNADDGKTFQRMRKRYKPTTSNTAKMGGRQYGRKEERQDRTSLPHRGPMSPQHAYLAYSGRDMK